MRCVIIHKYGPAAEVLKYEDVETPSIHKDEVLIEQHASSVNPIDCRMREGYGRVILSMKRGFELPLILGRDVSGRIIKVGSAVTKLAVGDAVYGFPATKGQGAYAEFVVAKADEVVLKPPSLSFIEAAALPYVTCTVWDALVTKGGLSPVNARGKRVFVQGGAGGIGSMAIQFLKAWGAYVATTCSQTQVESVTTLGADLVIDYQRDDYASKLSEFDLALETIGGPLEDKTLGILKKDGKSKFSTLIHPTLKTFDDSGIVKGGIQNLCQFIKKRKRARSLGVGTYSWAMFKPNADALVAVKELVQAGRMRPHIDRQFALTEMVAAHEYCEQGRSNGKVVIQVK